MNWSNFWGLWRVWSARHALLLVCPWFSIHLATGWQPLLETPDSCWRGLVVRWGHFPGWNTPEGCYPYRYVDESMKQRRANVIPAWREL